VRALNEIIELPDALRHEDAKALIPPASWGGGMGLTNLLSGEVN